MDENVIRILIALFSFSGGAFLGHRFALGRDKRKEFILIATPLKLKLRGRIRECNSVLEHIEQCDIDRHLYSAVLLEDEINSLEFLFSDKKIKKLHEVNSRTYSKHHHLVKSDAYSGSWTDTLDEKELIIKSALRDAEELSDLLILNNTW